MKVEQCYSTDAEQCDCELTVTDCTVLNPPQVGSHVPPQHSEDGPS